MLSTGGDGVLLVAHGTVANVDELPAFLAEIRHGRPAPASLVDELRSRYTAIGGSPLLELTRAQAAALAAELGVRVEVAMRLWQPRVEEVLVTDAMRRLQRLCVLPLAPFSVHVYNAAAERSFEAARARVVALPAPVYVENWGLCDEFVAAQATLIAETLRLVSGSYAIVLTAHSLPEVVIERGDPYAQLVERAAARIAEKVGQPVTLAYQSQGADGGRWLGPELADVFETLARDGVKTVVLSPFGFLADHVETLYDIDIEASRKARALRLEFVRVPTLNAHPLLVSAMAQVVRRALGEAA